MVHVVKSDISDKDFVAQFIRCGTRLTLACPPDIPRLEAEMKTHLSPANPYFNTAQVQLFIAYDHGQAVGRLSAQIEQGNKRNGIGHFGFPAAQSEEALRILIKSAQRWLRTRECQKISGPYSLSINDQVGLLYEGFNYPPRLLMNYSPAWISKTLESIGFSKAKDLLAYDISTTSPLPEAALKLAGQTQKNPDFSMRPLSRRKLTNDLKLIQDIFNSAWAENWGFVPLKDEDMSYMASTLKPVLDPALTRIAFYKEHPAAMIIALPDINELIADFKGRLLPFNWARFLWRLKTSRPKTARVLLMGVKPEYQANIYGSALSLAMIAGLHQSLRDKDYETVEMSWILENNKPMRNMIKRIGGSVTRRYRIYEKPLT